ncbi:MULTISPECIES: hypothetical protein [Gammaproteobacteria]|uniref:hypothetical protein n=1 Tax=Gammaproteobacteria TaxID=1236 RepID=UPI002FCB7FD1
MIDYALIQEMTNQGIDDFSSGGSFDVILSGAGVEIVNGVEVVKPVLMGKVYGAVRAIAFKYIDGESILSGDKRAFFSNVTAIENGMIVVIGGEHWRIVDTRPVNPTQDHVIAYRPILRKVSTYGKKLPG